MRRDDLEILSTEELWVLYEKVTATLKPKIIAEKKVLEARLSQLNGRFRVEQTSDSGAPILSDCFPKISKSGTTFGDLGGPREEAALADRTA